LREALKILAAENLVDLYKNRGAIVAPISIETIGAKFAVMAALEGFAAKLVCMNATDEQLALLRKVHEKLSTAFQKGELKRYFELNQEFHYRVIEMAANPVLTDLHFSLSRHVRRARYEGVLSHLPLEESVHQHSDILDALLARDVGAARDAMEHHVNSVAQLVIRYFRHA
jgi:DNA-binding GntR family transcriptional regulator